MRETNKKSVFLLSGFLGSGKTSLLKQVIKIQKENGLTPAVLMNEIGSVSIDSEEVDKDLPLAELLDGCICCTIQDKLESQLQNLLLNEKFDVLIIETTGAAHPVEVVDAVMSPLFADSFEFKGILTVVDAWQWKKKGSFSPQILQLLYEQVKHASLILVNKEDLVSEMEAGIIVGDIQSLNKKAQILLTTHAKLSSEILNQLSPLPKQELIKTRVNKELSLQAFVYTFKGSVNQVQFEDWMRSIEGEVYRMKGYVPFTSEKYPMLFQYSFGMPVYLPEDMNMPKNLVIIGEGLSKNKIFSDLDKLDVRKEEE
ncbi:CobW family GTP-binding protein [Jeotgalibacillus proteolyticus]|uniref:Cobalamin biosynthesis protein n=1 Tax=Jeotgalibacillus proteolyticus TaxID=2082395 RepID=A0A2S5GDV2_9BACL|nr:GTP-binding protein [Jeotgalibacillus proteolyticus]PPA71190.1 cobalamin biosynthesis protein [Jeotgalibacillus proteolyticus]